ncbi:hypothetical protein GCM10011509_21600 [Ornithinimicrobium pekingense]|uniref:DUF732 domain-containing protein n=2 Tax=Ornithinimicrobium pekingense TaxID=384677 RepID=A0ABQ2F8U0_9MICO|nr:hypothetical protein GCM10011509_21600 [Ornithinimicrobium pekingense]
MRMSTRVRYAAALAAAGLVTSAGAASAHHCYKDQWADAAYQHHLAGGTAWTPLSDLGTMIFLAPGDVEKCGGAVDDAVAAWMVDEGLTQEPLIHSRAIVGSGAMGKGKAPTPFEYLSDDDFGALAELAVAHIMEAGCVPMMPPM